MGFFQGTKLGAAWVAAAGVLLLLTGWLLRLQIAPSGAAQHLALVFRLAGVLALLLWAIFLRRGLTQLIVAGMAVGMEVGLDAPAVAISAHFLSDIFLRLVKTIVAPLILTTLITGIAGHGDLKSVGRMGWKSLVYFEALTTVALVLGLAAANIAHVGTGLHLPAAAGSAPAAAPMHWQDFVTHIFPENLAKSIAEGQVLQVAVFGVLFGMALASLRAETAAPVLRLTAALGETMFRFTGIVMYLAPLAVAASIAYTVAMLGPDILLRLGKLLLVFYATAMVFLLGVLLPVVLLCRLPLRRFIRHVSGPAAIAFATAASEAALPRAMEEMEAFGVPRRVLAFVLPAGYSFNLDGSTLYLAMAMIFVAQAAGLPLGWGQQLIMMGTLLLASKGVAGVPRAMLVVLLATSATLRLPTEPIVVLLGIDALMDMGRTAVNVIGNCLASAAIARWEGVFDEPKPALLETEALEGGS